MDRLHVVHQSLGSKLARLWRLMPTTTATTLRKSEPQMVIDGPFAETKNSCSASI